MSTQMYYSVYHKQTGLWVKKQSNGGFSYVGGSDRATQWKNIGHLKNAFKQGVLAGVKNLVIAELTVETKVTAARYINPSDIL